MRSRSALSESMTKTSAYREYRKGVKRRRFMRSGMKPWTKGYIEYKEHEIARVLEEQVFTKGKLPGKFGYRIDERIVEYPWLFSRLPATEGTLLDAGSVLNFEYLLRQPQLAKKKVHICTLAPEERCFWELGVNYLFEDLRKLPYRDEWFDQIVCLSTIEHVGMDNSLYSDGQPREQKPGDFLGAVTELKRVLKPGGTIYFSVPYGKAMSHGWFQVFDEQLVEHLIRGFGPAKELREYFIYKPDGWHRSNAAECADARIFDIHHAKDYDADFAAAARAVCCMELKK
jgi:SAM-dependent methyltransferase